MGKKRSRRQPVLILTETNSVVDDVLEVPPTDAGYAESPDTVEAWALDANQQALNQKGEYVQVICERSFEPIRVFNLNNGHKSDTIVHNVDTIASQKHDEELSFMEEKKSKSSQMLWLGIIGAIIALTFALVVLSSMKGGVSCSPGVTAMGLPSMAMVLRRLKKKDKDEKEPNSLVFRDKDWGFNETFVEAKDIPHDSRLRKYRGLPLHILNLDEEGDYSAIGIPAEIKKNKSPKDLWQSLNCEKEVNETYGMSDSVTEKIKLGVFVALIIVLTIVIFFIVMG